VIARKTSIISLVVNFSVQWALALLCWMGCFHTPAMVIWLAPLAPPYYGAAFLANRDLDMAFVSLGVSIFAIGLCLLAILKPRLATLIPAHIMLVGYWFWSFCLLGIGV
jgi:hypothetical protein